MSGDKNNMTGIHSTWNSIIITERTHEKAFFHISESSHLRNLCFYTCCMGESIEWWLWIHTILIVTRKTVCIAGGCVSAAPGRSVQGVLVCFFNVSPSHKLHLISHTNTYGHTHFDVFAPYQTQVVQSCMMGVVCCSCLWVQCSRELELFRGTRQRSEGRPLCSTPQQHNTRRNSFLMSLLRSV